MSRQTVPIAAIFWLMGLMVFWGASWPAMKYAVGEMPIFTFRYITAFGGGVAVLALSAMQGISIGLPRHEWAATALSGLFNVTGWFYFTAVGLTLLPAGRAAVLAYTMPLFAVVAARIFLKEPITRQKAIGLALGMTAILLLLGDDVALLGRSPLGALAVLAAAASWGLGTIVQKRHWDTHVLTHAGWQLLIGGVPLLALALLYESHPFERVTAYGWVSVLYVILVANMLGFWAWFSILKMAPTSVASIAVLPVPLVGVLSSMIVLGERIDWPEILALLFITAALATVLPLPRPFRR
ncbi:MAG: DMT family transporter [Pseudomonadota bacterium]